MNLCTHANILSEDSQFEIIMFFTKTQLFLDFLQCKVLDESHFRNENCFWMLLTNEVHLSNTKTAFIKRISKKSDSNI